MKYLLQDCVVKYILKDTEQQSTHEVGCKVEYILRGLYSGVNSDRMHSAVYYEGAG